MIRVARSFTVAALILISASARAQPPDSQVISNLVRALPASALDKQTIGVRGMELAVSSKLDPRLRQLLDEVRRGGDGRSRAIDLGATAADTRVPVTVHAPDLRRLPPLMQEIAGLGGDVMATYDSTVWARLSPAAVDTLAASPNTHYLTVQPRMEITQAPGTLEGSLRATRVQGLHRAGVKGRGIRIGIIDLGFGGYARLQAAGAVPVPKATRSFPASHAFENDVVHGAACAEIIHAMAPDAELLLVATRPEEGNAIAAARWLIAQGVDIISFSMGTPAQPGDGSGEMARFVDSTTTEHGVLWVVSSGNAGADHWRGTNRDANSEGVIAIGPDRKAGIVIVPATDRISLLVRWNDWGPDPRQPRAAQDIDAFLFQFNPTTDKLERVAASTDTQAGGPGPPLESLTFAKAGIKGQPFVLVLKNARVTREVDVHVFLNSLTAPAQLAPQVATGSVLSPASARYAVAVGAWDSQTSALAPYSSQGPTEDNRLKPEISAPAGLPSQAYGHRFDGTSASCPHAAGFAALLKQTMPAAKGLELRAALLRMVEPHGSPVPNATFGFGWIDGERLAAATAPPAAPPAVRPPTATPPAHFDAPGPSPAPVGPSLPETPPRVSAVKGRDITLPLAWGGAVPVAFLDQLATQSDRPDEFLARVITARDLYAVGDGLRVAFKASTDASYLLFHRSSSGEYTLLSPRGAIIGQLEAGASYVLPSEENTFEVTLPTGTEELLLVCARQPLDLAGAARRGRVPDELVVARHRYQVVR